MLPAALRARIEARNIPRDRVDILVSSQDNIYDGGGGLPQRDWYEFKPQYWLYQDVPFEDYPLSLARIEAGLFRADTESSLTHPEAVPSGSEETLTLGGAGFDATVFGTVSLGSEDYHGPVVAGSSESLVLQGVDFNRSYGFWTLAMTGGQAAATLHLLLNDADQDILGGAPGLGAGISLDDLIGYLEEQGFSVAEALAGLRRPVVTQVDRRAAVVADPANPERDLPTGMDAVTLWGDLFTDVTGIFVDGVPVADGQIQVDSQALLRVLVPTGTQGAIQVWTTRGPSALVPLP